MFPVKLPFGRGGDLLTGIWRDTGRRSNRWTSLSILIGNGNLYPVLQDAAQSCRAIFQAA